MWAAAVTEAGSLDQTDVIAALITDRSTKARAGPAAMVPGPASRPDEHVHRPGARPVVSRSSRDWARSILTNASSLRPPSLCKHPPSLRSGEAGMLITVTGRHVQKRETAMMLATTRVQNFDRWMEIFSTTSAEKRKQHGSKGAIVFRDPAETDRVWVLFDWARARLEGLRVRPRSSGHPEGRRSQGESRRMAALAGRLGS
jgi:hypothetical protein